MHRQVGSHHIPGHIMAGNLGHPAHGGPGGFLIDDDFIMGTDLGDHINDEEVTLVDEVEVLN